MKGRPLRFHRGHANRTIQRPPLDETDYTVEDRGHVTACWVWKGFPSNKGYGKVSIAGRQMYAHRAMYEQEVGPIPAAFDVDHLCRVTLCVNPAHLEPVSHAVNLRRGKGAKLTEDDVRAILLDDRPQRVIAEAFGVSGPHVSRIKSGERWR